MSRPAKGHLPDDPGKPADSIPVARSIVESSPAGQRHQCWMTFAVCLVLALAVWAVFGQTLRDEFINYDDDVYVYNNPAIRQGFSLPGVVSIFTHINGAGEWLPVTALSRMLDCQLYGLHPGGHHLTNVVLQALTAILLFLALRAMTGMFWPAAFVAAVFAIHPLRVESVAWVTERKDVLSGFFFMLTLLCYAKAVAGARWPAAGTENNASAPIRSRFYWLALLFFSLGLLSKPMLVTLPFVLMLMDYWPLSRLSSNGPDAPRPRFQTWLGLLFEKIPFLLLSAVDCVVTVLAQRNAIGSVQAFDFPSRIGNALMACVAYLGQMFYPAGMAVFYPYPRNHIPHWQVGLSLLVLCLISAGVMAGRRKRHYLLVGWLWYLGMLVPVIGLVQAGDQARADRYTYLPQIGLNILVTWGAMDLCRAWRHHRAVLGFAATAILAVLLAVANVQTGYWKDSVSLWTHTLACTSGNYLAQNNLAMALAEQGRLTEAIGHYEQALQIEPDYVKAQNNLGVALAGQGRLTEAVEHYQRALQLRPDDAEVHNNFGIALAGLGRPAEAIDHYQRALQLDPDNAEAHNNLGVALASQGRLTEAIEHDQRALQFKPDFAQAHYNLGNALAGQGRLAEAVTHYEQALQLKPDYAEVHNNLGMVLARQGNFAEAVKHYERVLQLRPDAAEPHFNLGNVLASQGKSAEAISQFRQALALATTQGNSAFAESIRDRLKSAQPP